MSLRSAKVMNLPEVISQAFPDIALHRAPPSMPAGGSCASEERVVPAPILWNDGTVTKEADEPRMGEDGEGKFDL